MAPAAVSAFEARRRENVANNAKLLAESQALGAKMARAAKPPPRPAAPRKRKAAEPAQRTRVMPTRQSARLSASSGDEPLTSLRTEREIIEADRPAKKTRMTEDITLSKVSLEGSRWTNGDALASFAVSGAQPGLRTFTDDDIKETPDEKLKSLRKGMAELELYDGWLPNGRLFNIKQHQNAALTRRRYQDHTRADIFPNVPPRPGQANHPCWRQEGSHGRF